MPDLHEPPEAPRRPSTRTLHGDRVVDDYAWMRQTDAPALLEHLAAENAWTDQQSGHLAALRATVYDELSRILPEDDESAPWRAGDWVYRTRRHAGQQLSVLTRRPAADPAADEQVVLDENRLAADAGSAFVELGVCDVSPDGRLLAYSVDFDGSEIFTLRVRDLTTGEDLADELTGTSYGLGWAADSGSIFYTTLDAALRPDTVHRHVLGSAQADDRVVWREDDRRFEVQIEATRSGAYVLLVSVSRDTSEIRLVPTGDPTREAAVIQPREPGVEYHADHQRGPDGGRLVIVTDDAGAQFRVVTAPVATPGREHWQELLPHRPEVRVVSADAFADHVVVTERHAGHLQLRVLDAAGDTVRLLVPDGVGEAVRLGRNEEYDVAAPRVVREGWVRPARNLDADLGSGDESLVHEQRVLTRGGYSCEQAWATAEDGTRVPMTLVSAAQVGDGPRPCLLYGYGAYESCLDPELWWEMQPLLDRGFLLAIAHVRGGGELGRDWWQQGRLLRKRTTFTDFVACARHLVAAGLTRPDLLAARGLSAGGLLMGAVAHLAPDAFAAIVAQVPFVDVVTTMLDDTLPLTVGEWEEWGDPRIAEHYAYLRSYSPYDNLPGPARPALLVTASRHDPRVSVHEPAKWVAAIRAAESGAPVAAPLLMRTALGAAAHTGPAGRYDAWREEAFVHAFVLDALGVAAGQTT